MTSLQTVFPDDYWLDPALAENMYTAWRRRGLFRGGVICHALLPLPGNQVSQPFNADQGFLLCFFGNGIIQSPFVAGICATT